ncbi:MAG: transposase [Elusimicrobia bacterium]|nr:transposase [Elusimicrobiota bacterium]
MARQLRINLENALYYVFSRGNDKKPVFLHDQDRESFISLLNETFVRYGFKFHAYALLNNQYHLLVETPGANLSMGMRLINGRYAEYFNRRHGRVGHLFQGRFKALILEKESYLAGLSRYIHLQPVAANLAFDPWVHPWSSCRDYLALRKPPAWLNTADVLSSFAKTKEGPILAYKNFLMAIAEHDDPTKKAMGQTLLGSKEFAQTIKRKIQNSLGDKEIAHRNIFKDRLEPDVAESAIAKVFDLNPDELAGGRQNNRLARKFAIYILRERSGLSLKEMAGRFLMGEAGISKLVTRLKSKIQNNEDTRRHFERIEAAIAETIQEKTPVSTAEGAPEQPPAGASNSLDRLN